MQNDVKNMHDVIREMCESLRLTGAYIFNSANGFMLAAVPENKDSETTGSLSSGSISALQQLFTQFGSDRIEYQIVRTDTGIFLFFALHDNYCLVTYGPGDLRPGYLFIRASEYIDKIRSLTETFVSQSDDNISRMDIDDISQQIDEEFDKLISED